MSLTLTPERAAVAVEIIADQLYTPREAADFLRISVTSVRHWLRRGHLTAVRVGPRKVMLRGSDIQAAVTAYKAAS